MSDSQPTRALSDLSRYIPSLSSNPDVLYIEEMEARESWLATVLYLIQ